MIDVKTIKHISVLSRIEMGTNDVEKFSKDLSKVLNYFDQIAKINTEKIEPLTTPVENETLWREDKSTTSFTPEEMLSNAPTRAGNLFKVPPVV